MPRSPNGLQPIPRIHRLRLQQSRTPRRPTKPHPPARYTHHLVSNPISRPTDDIPQSLLPFIKRRVVSCRFVSLDFELEFEAVFDGHQTGKAASVLDQYHSRAHLLEELHYGLER